MYSTSHEDFLKFRNQVRLGLTDFVGDLTRRQAQALQEEFNGKIELDEDRNGILLDSVWCWRR
jgi:hypothetical protein